MTDFGNYGFLGCVLAETKRVTELAGRMPISRDGFRRPNTVAPVSLQSEPFCTVFQEADCESVDAPLTIAAEPPIETTYLLLTVFVEASSFAAQFRMFIS